MSRPEVWCWPAAFGPPPSLRKTLASMAENIADAEKRYAEACRRHTVAIAGTDKCTQADYDRRARGAELAHWRSEERLWRSLLADYPHLANEPAEKALAARRDGVAPTPRTTTQTDDLWTPEAA